ncbi:MAG: sugar phosphate isomerase/epimerase, partial [Actinobacteria bacterium]|nr:sugar phosphate isomerase/epimerase [Actinomycetota bacterium]
CLWSLPLPPAGAARLAAAAGFDSIDVDPGFAQVARQESLRVSCAAVAHRMPAGAALEAAEPPARTQAVEHVRRALREAATLGTADAYVVPPATAEAAARARYQASLLDLADDAQAHGIRLAIEHFPGRGLPTVEATLAFIRATGHPNLYLLLDIGHCQWAREDVAACVSAAGDRLAYVHFDDNDGTADQHRAVLDGLQREEDLVAIVRALWRSGYGRAIGIETSPRLADPAAALTGSLTIVRRVLARA